MPRVVPSQVVAFIDTLFPEASSLAPTQQKLLERDRGNVQEGQLLALVNLIEQIPNELLELNPRQYTELVLGTAEIKRALEKWQMGGYHLGTIREFENLSPITLIHRALSACPDAFPSPGTADLLFITDQDLRESLRIDISAMNGALIDGQWKAGTVLAGSVIEALLLWALQQRNPAAIQAGTTTLLNRKALTGKPVSNMEEWTLPTYIEVASELGIIDLVTATQARLAKDFRNLIHPGRAQRLGQTCSRATTLSAAAAVEHVIRCLL